MTSIIEALAEYFTGKCVAHNSVCLSLPSHAPFAREFFELRRALGLDGYPTKDDAVKALDAGMRRTRRSEKATSDLVVQALVAHIEHGMEEEGYCPDEIDELIFNLLHNTDANEAVGRLAGEKK